MRFLFIARTHSNGSENSIQFADELKRAEEYAVALAEKNIGFFFPYAYAELNKKIPQDFLFEMNIAILRGFCDGLMVISDWKKSEDVKRQIMIAKRLHMPVFYPKSPRNIDEILEWAEK